MTSPWRELCGLDAYRISEIPRRPESAATGGPRMERDPGRAQRIAALVAAYHAGGTVAFGWIRLQAGGPIWLLAAGRSLAGSSGGADVMLALPGGARGQALGRGALASAMSRLACWRAIGGISDGLLLTPDAPPDREQATPSLEECLLPAWAGPFGWLVVAQPVPPPDLEWLADEAARHERLAIGLAERFPERDVAARRLRHRHTELRLGRASGMWHIQLLAGGADPAAAARVAALVCASADLSRLPYTLAPAQAGPGALRDLLGRPATGTATAATGQDDLGQDDLGQHGLGQHSSGSGGSSQAGPAAGQPDPGPAGGAAATDAQSGLRAPFYASTALLAALSRSPEAEIPGVRLALRPDFDVTPETAFAGLQSASPAAGETPAGGSRAASGSAAVSLGQVLDRQRMPAGPLQVPVESLNRHVFVCGATGGGKSQTVRALLEAASRAGVPWLVVEPAKAEYRLMAARLTGSGAEVVRIRPGEADAVAAGLNPLEPAVDDTGHRFPLQTHADLVRALFLAAFQSEEPFPQVLSAALTRMYEDCGWDLALGEPLTAGVTPGYPGLADLQRTAEQVVGEIGYSEEVKADVLGFIRVRLSSLRLGTTGRFLEGGHPVDVGRLLRRNTVLEIEDVGDDRDKAFLMGTVLLRLAEHLRLARRITPGGPPGLRHLTVVEEAHRLLRRPDREGGPAAHAVELFAGLLAEVRAYGEGIVIAEQIPAKLIPDVIKNTAVKIVHRLPAADDREAVGATMNLSPAQSRFLVTLAPGEAAVSVDGTDHPLLVRMPDGTARESAADPASTAAGLASPASVVAARSGTCGADCIARPCTLRDMRAAQRALERHPGIALWAELAVLSHLTGWPMPIPQPPLLETLRALPMRLRDCALSHGVDAAVASRAPLICGRVSPPALASHVVTALRARVSRGMWMCLPEEPRWLAPAYQWALLLDALTIGDPAPVGVGPDSRTDEWESVYGRPIAGPTRADQAATVHRWHNGGLRDDTRLRSLAFGLTAPSAVERAIGARADDEDFGPRLAGHLEEFEDCYWPHLYLKQAGTEPAAQ
ncbi:MAG: ATP-binding protein [Streptosporangiaceae bacterium]